MYKYTHSHKVDSGQQRHPLNGSRTAVDNGHHQQGFNGVNSYEHKSLRAFEGKRILVYRNGDQYHKGVIVAVSPRQYPTFPSLIQFLNSRQILESRPVNKLYDIQGHPVVSLLDLQDGHEYIAATGPFASVDYGSFARHNNWNYTRKISRTDPMPLNKTEREILENPDKVPSRLFRAKPPPITSLLPTGEDADLESFYRGRNGRFRAAYYEQQNKRNDKLPKPPVFEQIDPIAIDPFDAKYTGGGEGKVKLVVRAGRLVPLTTRGYGTPLGKSFTPPPPPPYAHRRHIARRSVSLNNSNSNSEDSRDDPKTPRSEPLVDSRERYYRDTYSASMW